MPVAGSALTRGEIDRHAEPVRMRHALAAVTRAATLQGHRMEQDRIETLAQALADPAEGWTVPELDAASRELGRDPEVRAAIRFGGTQGGTISLADFEAARSDERGAGGRRIARQRLFTYAEALARWQRAGEPGTFPSSMFEVVARRGEDGPLMLRLIG